MNRTTLVGGALSSLLMFGCGGEPREETQRAPAPAPAQPTVTLTAAEITPQMRALGDSVYHGLVGIAACQSCHGPQGQGTASGPNLTDANWLHSDGSPQGILNTIVSGVMAPREYPGMMPPYGGIPLPPEHARAIAAYVHGLGGGR